MSTTDRAYLYVLHLLSETSTYAGLALLLPGLFALVKLESGQYDLAALGAVIGQTLAGFIRFVFRDRLKLFDDEIARVKSAKT